MRFSLEWTRWLNPFRWSTGGYLVSEWDWHPWLAWYPVKLPTHDWVWLEWIERARAGGDPEWRYWCYRAPKKLAPPTPGSDAATLQYVNSKMDQPSQSSQI